jgi:Domain of unknown function (DUF4160)
MPKVFEWRGYRFHFFSFEGTPREPVHIHVAKPGAEAKFWLIPKVRLANSRNLSPLEIRRLEKVVEEHRGQIIEAWNDHFSR